MEKHSKSFDESYGKLKGFLSEAVANAEKCKKNDKLDTSTLNLAFMGLTFIEGNTEKIISSFLVSSFPHWEKISNKDLENLIENVDSIFQKVPQSYLDEIKSYLRDEEIISKKMYIALWNTVHQMSRSAVSYCHWRRTPLNGKYTVEFAPGVSVKKGVEFFKIESHN